MVNDSELKWAAKVENVQEVILRGHADLEYWRKRLKQHGVNPISINGRAALHICAADMRWKGFRFQELSFVVLAEVRESSDAAQAAWLIEAGNSNRFFAFIERSVFKTPYFHAKPEVRAEWPLKVVITDNHGGTLSAETGDVREATSADLGWQGEVFLPKGRVFFAKLLGRGSTFAFDKFSDRYEIEPRSKSGALSDLAMSGFTPTLWSLRQSAAHHKSKTYKV